jgi:hypothetical protein
MSFIRFFHFVPGTAPRLPALPPDTAIGSMSIPTSRSHPIAITACASGHPTNDFGTISPGN